MSGVIAHIGQIWLAVEPVDMRRSIDGLSLVVQQALDHSPCAGSAFVFCNRAGNRVKVLLWGWHWDVVMSAPFAQGDGLFRPFLRPFEKALSSFTISSSLRKKVDHFTVLAYRLPQIPLLTL